MLNRKRLLSLTLALLMVCSLLPTAAFAQDTCAHEWEWDEDDGPFYQICALCDEAWELEKITGPYEGSPVYWTLTPDGTMTVSGEGEFGEDYFYGDDLPDDQLAWEPYAPYVTTLVVEEGITYFYGTPDLTDLTSAYFPASLEEFQASKVLRGSPNLTTVTVDKDNPRYYTVDNVVFDRSNNTLLYYPRSKTATSYTVPGCSIGSNAFYNNKYLESVVVEEGAVYLATNAIYGCKNLTELTLPGSLLVVLSGSISDSVETIRYAGNETQWNRIYIHPDNDLSAVDVEFGVPKSDITAQWNLQHTILNLKGEAEGASYVLANLYQPDGQMVKSVLYTAQQVADGVTVNDPDTDLSDCSAKIVVLDSAFAPIYDCTVPDGDTDFASLKEFEGWLYEMSEMQLDSADDKDTREGELLFFDGEQTIVLDAAGVSTPGCMGLGQKYRVTYNWQTNDLVSMESAGVSVVGTAPLNEVKWTLPSAGSRRYLFTFGDLKDAPFDGDTIARMDMVEGFYPLSPAEMRDLAGHHRSDEYTAIDKEGDGDIDYLLVRPVQYGRVVNTGTTKKGDFIDVTTPDHPNGKSTRYYLEERQGADELPDDLEVGDIVKLTMGFEDSETAWEALPSASMTLEEVIWQNSECGFDGKPFRLAENGWDLKDILTADKLGDSFTVVYDGDLVVWAETDIIPLDAAEIYADGDQIDPDAKDAVELMYALGLMGSDEDAADTVELLGGDAKGNFHPERAVTRAEMAKIIYIILNYGEDDSAKNYRGANIFSDVEPGSWYEGYVNYCATIKLIQGQDDGTFGPDEAISGVKAAKMLLTVIGYDAEDRGYVGDGWEHQVLADASILGLLEGYKANTADPAPRQWLAKMVENCLLKCTDAKNILMGEKYFKLTEDSEIYRSVYTEPVVSDTYTGTIKAAQVMNFADSLTAFENLGGNDNTYIVIDSLPTHGRLVYKWGTAQQEEVEVGEKFYLSAAAKRLLGNVSYVPAYSADKIDKADSFAVTGVARWGRGEVEGTVNITIEHAQKSACFTDVTDSYYADSVDFVYNQKISTGMTTYTFGLTANVTRGQFVTFLYRAAGSPLVTGVTNNFTDVSTSDYYYNAIMWAVSNGLVTGRSATTFDPSATLTRQEALTFLYRFYANYLGRDLTLGSPDGITDYADVDAWAQTPVRWAVAHGFVGDGALEPKSVLDRGTTAIYFHGTLTGLAGSSGGSATPKPDPEPTPNPDPGTDTVLAHTISHISASGAVSLDVLTSDGTAKTLYVTEVDGQPADAKITLPAFYVAAENADGEASLTHITRDFEAHGIYAGQVSKFVLSSNSIHLDDDAKTLLTAAEAFTLYDGSFAVESNELTDVSKKTPYIFFAPDEMAVYAVDASNAARNDLFVRLGGLHDTAAKYGDSYFIDPDARDAINLLVDIDLMLGNANGNYNPNGTVTRAEVAKMIYEILHYGEDDQGEDYRDMNLFTDVASADWYSGYVNYCAASGLMGGKADGTFAPYETVTCPQMAKILLMALGYDPEARGYVGANWADAVLSDAAILDLLNGYNYPPHTTAPRQWMAVMIANALRNCYTYAGDAPVKFATLVTRDIAAADRKSYVLMGDKYYDLGLDPDPELTLLVDGYYGNDRNGKVYAVDAMVDGEVVDCDVNPSSDIAAFLDDSDSNNNWGRLIPYAGDEKATTNVAEYTLDADGVMSLYQTRKTIIDLYEEDAEASQTSYYGECTDENGELLEDVRVQATKNTVFYYVDAEGAVLSVTHYKESYNVFADVHGIRAMYAVATNTAEEGENPYFTANMIVVETDVSVLTPKVSVILGYDGTYYANKAYTRMDAVDSDGEQVMLFIGEEKSSGFSGADMMLPAFYVNTEQADGNHLPALITDGNYKANGVYAVTLERVNALHDYIVTTDGDELALADTTPVYRLYAADSSTELTAENEYGDALTLQSGSSYILYTENSEVVYAVLVQNADDPAAALYTQICGKELPPVNTDQQTADQIAAELQPMTVEIDQIAAVKDAVYAALTAQNGNASYDVVLPDFSLDGAAGEKTLEGVLVTVQVGEATAQTTISITVLY